MLKWSGVCVHCRAQIGGRLGASMRYPATFHDYCHDCEEPLVITLLPEGAMVAVPQYWRQYPKKP